jgi:hypothetical protein
MDKPQFRQLEFDANQRSLNQVGTDREYSMNYARSDAVEIGFNGIE